MKSLILFLLTTLLVASTAFAVVDEDPDMVGLYFDMTADTACLGGVAPYQTIPGFLCLPKGGRRSRHGQHITLDDSTAGTGWPDLPQIDASLLCHASGGRRGEQAIGFAIVRRGWPFGYLHRGRCLFLRFRRDRRRPLFIGNLLAGFADVGQRFEDLDFFVFLVKTL